MEITIYTDQIVINEYIDSQILEWVKNNYGVSNFSQELHKFICYLRQTTLDECAIKYLDYKLKLDEYLQTKNLNL